MPSAGAVHSSVMVVVDWCVLATPVTSAGAVDWSSATLVSPSPAALSALTTYEYCVPPVSPATVALEAGGDPSVTLCRSTAGPDDCSS